MRSDVAYMNSIRKRELVGCGFHIEEKREQEKDLIFLFYEKKDK